MRSFFRNLISPLDNINEVALNYAGLFKLRVTKTTLRKTIDKQPDYPSMLVAESGTLWRLQNKGKKRQRSKHWVVGTMRKKRLCSICHQVSHKRGIGKQGG